MMSASAVQSNVRVATYLRALGDVSAYKARQALLGRTPPLDVSRGVLRQWILKYRKPASAVAIAGADELEKKCGSTIRLELAAKNRTGYKLMTAVRQLQPPLCITRKSAENWLAKYGQEAHMRKERRIQKRPAMCVENT